MPKFFEFTGFNLLLAFMSSLSLFLISPAASGSGIPDVKVSTRVNQPCAPGAGIRLVGVGRWQGRAGVSCRGSAVWGGGPQGNS